MSLATNNVAFFTNSGTDQSPNNNNLTPTGSPGTATGPDGIANSAMQTDSDGTYYSGSFLPTTYPFSLSAFILPDSEPWASIDGNGIYILNSLSAPDLQWFSEDVLTDTITYPSVPSGQTWLHVVLTVDGSRNEILYADAIQVATGSVLNSPPWSSTYKTLSLNGAVPFRQAFTGIWNRVLSSSEVVQLFNNGAGLNPFGTPNVTTQPVPIQVSVGGTALFSVTVTGAPTLAVQWQFSGNAGLAWSNVSNGGNYSGATTSILAVKIAGSWQDGNLFRALVTNSNGFAYSNQALLSVPGRWFSGPENPFQGGLGRGFDRGWNSGGLGDGGLLP